MDDGIDMNALPVEQDRIFTPFQALDQCIGQLQLAAQNAFDHFAVAVFPHGNA